MDFDYEESFSASRPEACYERLFLDAMAGINLFTCLIDRSSWSLLTPFTILAGRRGDPALYAAESWPGSG